MKNTSAKAQTDTMRFIIRKSSKGYFVRDITTGKKSATYTGRSDAVCIAKIMNQKADPETLSVWK